MSILTRMLARRRGGGEEQSFALDRLDLKLRPYLSFEKGFFIEAGANDGLTYSNTLYFEKYKNWTGILIEAIPELAAKCRVNRPACIVENCALVPFSYKDPDIEMRYCNLMSLVKGGMKTSEAELAHIKMGCEIQKVSTYELTVPASTLTSVLDRHRVKAIDFLSLDVEGFELSVLRGIDFEKYRPAFMLIEARERREIDSYLERLYEPVAELSDYDVLYRLREQHREAAAGRD